MLAEELDAGLRAALDLCLALLGRSERAALSGFSRGKTRAAWPALRGPAQTQRDHSGGT